MILPEFYATWTSCHRSLPEVYLLVLKESRRQCYKLFRIIILKGTTHTLHRSVWPFLQVTDMAEANYQNACDFLREVLSKNNKIFFREVTRYFYAITTYFS